jgi:hypothetical protein
MNSATKPSKIAIGSAYTRGIPTKSIATKKRPRKDGVQGLLRLTTST